MLRCCCTPNSTPVQMPGTGEKVQHLDICTLLVGASSAVCWPGVYRFSWNEAYTCHDPVIPSWVFAVDNENLHPHRNSHRNVLNSIVHNCPQLEKAQVALSRWISIHAVVHAYGDLFWYIPTAWLDPSGLWQVGSPCDSFTGKSSQGDTSSVGSR
jgi:hypothetical protein